MTNKIIDGFKFGLGIFLFFGIIFGIVFAVGFHTADEILGGTFTGNYIFSNDVTFNGNVNGIGIGTGGLTEMVIFNTPGTYTWTVPSGVTKIRVKVAGAGGGGSSDAYQGGTNGQQSSFTDNGINIIAYGGQGGRATGGYDNGALNSGGIGGIVLIGGGSTGGQGISFPATNGPTDGGAGGLVINTTLTSQGTNYTLTIGNGGAGGSTGNAAGSNGADGYVIIEY